MYAAKMSGQAQSYDLFTPDVGELSFLADESAPHPFYTRGFILHQDNQVPDLIARAYAYKNGARHLLVKGSVDYVVADGEITDQISEPATEAMEAIGGTGDTLTGLACALIRITSYNVCYTKLLRVWERELRRAGRPPPVRRYTWLSSWWASFLLM